MEKAAEKREDMRKTEQDRSRRRPERRDGNTGRGRAEGYGARKERTGSDRTEIHGRHGQAAGGEFRKQKYDRSAEYLAAADTDGAAAQEDGRIIEGRNAVLEAFRSGKTIDRLLIQDGCQDGPIQTIKREAKRCGTIMDFVPRERLDQISQTGVHQGVVAYVAAYEYAEVEDILAKAKEKGEDPFIILLDDIEDPHNLGAIIRTANLAGAHGVIIPKRRAVGLTATVARTSAGALNYTPVARVTNLGATIDQLKKEGIWFVCADMNGEIMYRQNLTGPIGLVIGNEGDGVGKLVREKCDMIASIPMKGDIDSLNASVATGVLAFEIVRQRGFVK